MPGAIAISSNWPPELGTDSITSRVSVCTVAALVTSTTGLWPLTVMVSWTVESSSSTFIRAVNRSVSRIPSRMTVEKPGSAYVTVYVPMPRPVNR